jgi:hypothetical protein
MPARKRAKGTTVARKKRGQTPERLPRSAVFPWRRIGVHSLGIALGMLLGIFIGLQQGWVEGHHSQHNENQRWQVKELVDGRIVKHGDFVDYYPDGKTLKAQGEYFMDQKHGQWSEYYPSGKLEWQGTYINGVAQNDWTQWDENGRELAKKQLPPTF